MKKNLYSALAFTFALSLPLATHPWNFNGFANWASSAFRYTKDSVSQFIQERPAAAAGIGIATIAVCGLVVLAKKYGFKKASNVVPQTKQAEPSAKNSQQSDVSDLNNSGANDSTADQQDPSAASNASQDNSHFEINVKEYKVLHQENNTCGFHALKNGILLHKMLLTGAVEESHLQEEFSLSDWQNVVNKNADLASSEIEAVAKYAKFEKNYYCVLSDISGFINDPAALTDEKFEILCDNLNRLQSMKDTKPFCFVAGNMGHTESQGKTKGSYGHWVALVAQANPEQRTITLHYANSLPSYSMTQSIEKLKDVIRIDPELLKLKRKLSACIGTISTKLTNDNQQTTYEECLTYDFYTQTLMNPQIFDDNQEHLYETLKPLQSFFKHINSSIIPLTKDDQAKCAWKELMQNQAIKRLALNSN